MSAASYPFRPIRVRHTTEAGEGRAWFVAAGTKGLPPTKPLDDLLKLQLDVPPGEKPWDVQQLVTVCKVVVKGGRFRSPGRGERGFDDQDALQK